ncbi:hypothetical protein SDC9_181852 [bioreactor metagenome]|uniref:Uncharacterized protein n=1 Tax=bioreactor metagenome TaxID=1076179 RepID=A0A645H8E2_9ZZZZ
MFFSWREMSSSRARSSVFARRASADSPKPMLFAQSVSCSLARMFSFAPREEKLPAVLSYHARAMIQSATCVDHGDPRRIDPGITSIVVFVFRRMLVVVHIGRGCCIP